MNYKRISMSPSPSGVTNNRYSTSNNNTILVNRRQSSLLNNTRAESMERSSSIFNRNSPVRNTMASVPSSPPQEIKSLPNYLFGQNGAETYNTRSSPLTQINESRAFPTRKPYFTKNHWSEYNEDVLRSPLSEKENKALSKVRFATTAELSDSDGKTEKALLKGTDRLNETDTTLNNNRAKSDSPWLKVFGFDMSNSHRVLDTLVQKYGRIDRWTVKLEAIDVNWLHFKFIEPSSAIEALNDKIVQINERLLVGITNSDDLDITSRFDAYIQEELSLRCEKSNLDESQKPLEFDTTGQDDGDSLFPPMSVKFRKPKIIEAPPAAPQQSLIGRFYDTLFGNTDNYISH